MLHKSEVIVSEVDDMRLAYDANTCIIYPALHTIFLCLFLRKTAPVLSDFTIQTCARVIPSNKHFQTTHVRQSFPPQIIASIGFAKARMAYMHSLLWNEDVGLYANLYPAISMRMRTLILFI